jgi:hypothetical protein
MVPPMCIAKKQPFGSSTVQGFRFRSLAHPYPRTAASHTSDRFLRTATTPDIVGLHEIILDFP